MKVALHICCAVCAAGAAERLIQEGHQVRGLFYNPNIHPEAEYMHRMEETQKTAKELGFPLTVADYQPDEWYKTIAGLEKEPEGGKRCYICFRMRMEKTYRFMLDAGCDVFTTTLTMGSNKPVGLFEQIGHEIGGAAFLSRDFKKRDGFKRAGELARKWGLYRQNYCGCIYSLRERESRIERKSRV